MTAPLTSSDCDCRGLPFMPLDVIRLRDSDFVATSTGDEFKAAVMLWCASWTQLPAASLPDDDRVLSRLAGVTPRTWGKIRSNALRGFILCDDGRLYHSAVAAHARTAFERRLKQREKINGRWEKLKKTSEKLKKTSEKSPIKSQNPEQNQQIVDTVVIPRTGTGTGTGKKKEESPNGDLVKPLARPPSRKAQFDEFWQEYPRRIAKATARKAFDVAVKRTSFEEIMGGLRRAKWPDDPQFIRYPATWLRGDCWEDEPCEIIDMGQDERVIQMLLAKG